MADSNDVDLLLIGKTGNGKSAAGNSILKREVFESVSSTTSVTIHIQYEVSEFRGRIIKIVDCPGVGDTRMKDKNCIRFTMEAIQKAIAINPRGYHAFILVVRFGGRFTQEDLDTIEFLKKMFGQDFVKNFCILLITCGDDFGRDSRKTGKSFPQWCSEQQGELQNLIKECDNRVVLFDNVTEDEEKKNKQIENLLQVVDNLRSRGKRYTDKHFDRVKQARDRFMVEHKKSVIQDETMTETSLILAKFKEVREISDLREKLDQFEKLHVRTDFLHKSLVAQDRGTGVLHDICLNVDTIKSNISGEITVCKVRMEERENARLKEETNERAIQRLEERHKQEEAQMMQKYEEMVKGYTQVRETNQYGWMHLLPDAMTGISWLLMQLSNSDSDSD